MEKSGDRDPISKKLLLFHPLKVSLSQKQFKKLSIVGLLRRSSSQ
jgi:hypothetical protein